MAKDPAFLFYPKDWIEGTLEMLPNEKGVYIDLLAHQHQKGSLPNDTKRLCRLVSMSENEFLVIWNNIKDKFMEVYIDGIPNGHRLVNQKLFELVNKRKENAFIKKISGTFAYIIKTLKCNKLEKEYIKEKFKAIDFIGFTEDLLKEKINDWVNQELKLLDIPNGIPNGSKMVDHSLANVNTIVFNNNKEQDIPTFEKVYEVVKRRGGTKEMAESFFNKHEAMNWTLGGAPIVKWEFLVNNFVASWLRNEEERNKRKTNNQPEFDPTKVKIKLK